jgi:hypothetical protein
MGLWDTWFGVSIAYLKGSEELISVTAIAMVGTHSHVPPYLVCYGKKGFRVKLFCPESQSVTELLAKFQPTLLANERPVPQRGLGQPLWRQPPRL